MILFCIGLIHHRTHRTKREKSDNFLDGCYHVYLDLGTNVGIQVRKLYEPKLYPEAKLHEFFEKYFKRGKSLPYICTVGFEPNPNHVQALEGMFIFFLILARKFKLKIKSAASFAIFILFYQA